MIRSNLKEGVSAQRIIIQTYNYDLRNNKEINLEEVLKIKNIDKSELQGKITDSIKTEQKKVLMVGEVCQRVEQIKTKEKIEEFRKWINGLTGYTEAQKNVMLRKLEEQEKVCE